MNYELNGHTFQMLRPNSRHNNKTGSNCASTCCQDFIPIFVRFATKRTLFLTLSIGLVYYKARRQNKRCQCQQNVAYCEIRPLRYL